MVRLRCGLRIAEIIRTRFSVAVLAFLTLAGCSDQAAKTDTPNAAPTGQTLPVGTGFDFYVLSLSWSPSWCARNDQAKRSRQCRTEKGFVLHGLWPQNERGYPEYCKSTDLERVPEELGTALFDLFPSMGLIGHQWRKHGTCSGLSQQDYFATVRAAADRVTLPPMVANGSPQSIDALENAFVRTNTGMTGRGIAVTCERRQIEEIRICLTKTLQFRDCAEVDRRSCKSSSITVPPA
ncbi:ribonuclease T(2) [Rhizobium sp. CFBP 8762]|nr:ribonuclease T(2) [Rhizobium sp. CFBP 8762]MBD8553037.1 ribonuclease T(2) [Rhizobium sp. CFBP 8762]